MSLEPIQAGHDKEAYDLSSIKMKILKNNWSNAKIDGAELVFCHMMVPELKEDYVIPDDMNILDIPEEAYTGLMKDSWSVGWKSTINGNKYGYYVLVDSPAYNHEVYCALNNNFQNARKHIENKAAILSELTQNLVE